MITDNGRDAPYAGRQIVVVEERLTRAHARLVDEMWIASEVQEKLGKSVHVAAVDLPAALMAFDGECGRSSSWSDKEDRATGGQDAIDFAWNN